MQARGIAVGCLLVSILGACGEQTAPGASPLTPEAARTLVAEAAATTRTALDTIIEFGAEASMDDVAAAGNGVPLTLAVLGSPLGPRLHEDDFRFGGRVVPAHFLDAVDPRGAKLGLKTKTRPSLIHEEYITGLEVNTTGDAASGEVRFEAPDVYRGRARFLAVHVDGTWRVTEFLFPRSDVRIALADGRWTLHAPDGAATGPAPGVPLRLPQVTQVGRAPDEDASVVIRLTRDGALTAAGSGAHLSLRDLRTHLTNVCAERGERWVEADGASALHVVLEIDADVPWMFAQWIMGTCAHPDIKIYRIAFRAIARETQETGTIGTELPKDRGGGPDAQGPVRRIKVFKTDRQGPTDLLAVWEALQRMPAEERAKAAFEIVATPPKGGGVPTGYVVQIVDLVLRAGGTQMLFEGAAMPMDIEGREDPTWIGREIRRVREQEGEVLVRMGTRSLDVEAPQALSLPTGGRVDEVLELEAPHFSQLVERIIAEPVIRDEEIEDLKPNALPKERGLGTRGKPRPDGDPLAKRVAGAVDAALRWLAAHQAANGGWESAKFGMWCDGKVVSDESKFPSGKGKWFYDVGVTGLAVNAFLSAGYTNRGKHPYAKVVSRALRYLKNVQDPEGCFGPRTTQQYAYNHATAALAMVEIYGMTGSPIFKGSAQRALDFVAYSRNPYFAWRYGVKPGDNDTSITTWMVSVLGSARLINRAAVSRDKPAPLTVDEEAFKGVRTWIDKVVDPGTGRAGYLRRGGGPARPEGFTDAYPIRSTASMTAASIWARILLGDDPRPSKGIEKGIEKGLEVLARLTPTWQRDGGHIDMYYWYYGTLVSYQAGGAHWKQWEEAMDKAIIGNQRTDTDFCRYKGSWDPAGPWGRDGGRVYATAMMTLCLEVWDRYARGFGR